jgi:N-dimethylarginine dimethylaminohydrolase
MVDVGTAIINPTQLPFWFLQKLAEIKIRTIEVSHEDPVWTINCLAVRPGRVLMADQVSPRTLEKLDRAGISIRLVPFDKVYAGGGGIHCSTGPLIRDPV